MSSVETPRAANERLRSLILLDALISYGAGAFAVLVYFFAFDSGYMLVLSAVPLITAVILTAAVPLVRQGRTDRALALFAAANWFSALGVAVLGVFAWPLMLLAAVLPAIVVVPHADAKRVREYVVASLTVAVAVTLFGNLQDFSGLTEGAPGWAKETVVAFFAPFLSVLVVLTAWQNSARLQSALEAEVEINRELLASRRRLVAATDRERQRIERDLHDGAQQRLIALSMRVRTGLQQLDTAPDDARATLEQVQADVRETQSVLRELVQGVYPPVLTQHGLGAAIRSVAERSGGLVQADVAEVGRHPGHVEAAVYFVCLEATQNAAKHAGPDARVRITVRGEPAAIRFCVEDDGPGFDPTAAERGQGLANIRDRVAALAGQVEIVSSPGEGVVVAGSIPT